LLSHKNNQFAGPKARKANPPAIFAAPTQAPLIAQVKPTPKSDEDAAQIAAERQERGRPTIH